MFTGLVEGVGKIVKVIPPANEEGGVASALTARAAGTLWLDAGPLAEGVRPGDSIALNGCCLTAVEIDGPRLRFDLLQETERRTNLRGLRPGAAINLERALPASGRYGGHFVTGHVDATGAILRFDQTGAEHELTIAVQPAHAAYLVPKGCIAVDGISLTVGRVGPAEFSVWIIPHTHAVTALRERAVGDLVNLEFDLLAKYVEKILAVRAP